MDLCVGSILRMGDGEHGEVTCTGRARFSHGLSSERERVVTGRGVRVTLSRPRAVLNREAYVHARRKLRRRELRKTGDVRHRRRFARCTHAYKQEPAEE